jgi:hypothetical protein
MKEAVSVLCKNGIFNYTKGAVSPDYTHIPVSGMVELA